MLVFFLKLDQSESLSEKAHINDAWGRSYHLNSLQSSLIFTQTTHTHTFGMCCDEWHLIYMYEYQTSLGALCLCLRERWLLVSEFFTCCVRLLLLFYSEIYNSHVFRVKVNCLFELSVCVCVCTQHNLCCTLLFCNE